MKISKQYIDSAVKIRNEYFIEIKEVNKKEGILKEYKDKVEDIYINLENMVKNYNGSDIMIDEDFKKELNQELIMMEKVMTSTKNDLEPHFNKIEFLKKESDLLYTNIIEKFPGITVDEIQNQILPHLDEFKQL